MENLDTFAQALTALSAAPFVVGAVMGLAAMLGFMIRHNL